MVSGKLSACIFFILIIHSDLENVNISIVERTHPLLASGCVGTACCIPRPECFLCFFARVLWTKGVFCDPNLWMRAVSTLTRQVLAVCAIGSGETKMIMNMSEESVPSEDSPSRKDNAGSPSRMSMVGYAGVAVHRWAWTLTNSLLSNNLGNIYAKLFALRCHRLHRCLYWL